MKQKYFGIVRLDSNEESIVSFECVNLNTCQVINLPVDTVTTFDNLGEIYEHILAVVNMNNIDISFYYDFGGKFYQILWYTQGKPGCAKYPFWEESTTL